MSFLATVQRRAAPEPAHSGRHSVLRAAERTSADLRLGAGLAAGFAAIAFATTGGSSVAPNTWEEIVLLLLGWVAATTTLLTSGPARRWGAVTLALFAALTALTAASVAWSVQPANSWTEANRALSYLAMFGLAMAGARLLPGSWRAVLGGLTAFFGVVSAYALLSKVFPEAIDPLNFLGRLSAPFDYWNATGVAAAMGLPLAVWCGARQDRARLLRGLSVPVIAVELAVVILSYSRSAVLAAVIGLAVWFAMTPLRLRGAAILGLGAAGAAIISAWALSTHGLATSGSSLAVRSSAGHGFGVVLILVLALFTLLGWACAFAADRVVLSPRSRRRIGQLLLALLALVPVGAAGAAAASSRGFGGEISHLVSTLTSTSSSVGQQAGRLVQLGNSRPVYWSEGLKVAEHNLLHGAGAAAFDPARLRYTTNPLPVGHAHSYLIETFADLGIIGLAVNLALLLAWGLACCRTFGLHLSPSPRGRRMLRLGADPAAAADRAEQAGLGTLLAVVVAFGVQSLVDWTWFIPGVALPALFSAGWLVARGPFAEHAPRPQRRELTAHPGRVLSAALLGVATLLGVWITAQPLRAQQAQAASLAAAARGDGRTALAEARTAVAENPLSLEPLFQLSALYDALGQPRQAHAELVQALHLQPQNPQTWIELGTWDLQNGRPHASIGVLQHAFALNRADTILLQQVATAQAEVAATHEG